MTVLVINCGSSSLRFQLIDGDTHLVLAKGLVERIGAVSSTATLSDGDNEPQQRTLTANDHAQALKYALDFLTKECDALGAVENIEAVGHRVVHGGEKLAASMLIDDAVIASIRDAFDLAPLHNPANLEGIAAAQQILPNVPHVAVFDTAFHQTLPDTAYLYAVPYRLYRRHKIRRYGFHGTSHSYVSRRLFQVARITERNSRLITCHLGNGCSMAAIRDGLSIDTSMGLTPLTGLIMGTRSGDIDPSIIFYLMEKEEMALHDIHALLNRHSGLLGLSEYESDMRLVMTKANEGDERCRKAIDVYCYRIRSYIGQYTAALNGCDAIVFTAGVGENSPAIRALVCRGLGWLGVRLDERRNAEAIGIEAKISEPGCEVQVWVIPTNEELVIAQDALRIAA
ncbi:MAG: acetate kinase, partial [Gammaproteobacteria bacterium]|nr:acetate kinase [Gammaproteobacteria bacterium]